MKIKVKEIEVSFNAKTLLIVAIIIFATLGIINGEQVFTLLQQVIGR